MTMKTTEMKRNVKLLMNQAVQCNQLGNPMIFMAS